MAERVTIQDIADALGVSRNTVSKAINNTGSLADATREKVLQKAIEMGYKQFTYMNISNIHTVSPVFKTPGAAKDIALFTCAKLGSSHFSTIMLDTFQREITQLGYSLTMHRVTSRDRHSFALPNSFHKERTVGIICIETFHYEYSQMLCEIGLPILFVDSPVLDGRPLKADRLSMDNRNEIFAFVREMVSRKKTSIGFIGECRHCQSFFERYMAFREALYLSKLPCIEEYCITEKPTDVENPSTEEYQTYLMNRLQKMPKLPDVFICANDFVAIDALQALRRLNIAIPEDVYLCGFDDSPESKIVTPPLTTIHIHSEIMGLSAVQMLMSRIKEPSLNYRSIYTETNLVYRESTNGRNPR